MLSALVTSQGAMTWRLPGNSLARLLEPLLVAVDRGDMRAGLSKIDRNRAADAPAPAGHHADAAGQAKPVGRKLFSHGRPRLFLSWSRED